MNYVDELYHHGILGMHWGVRRYQNPDGSLTLEGRRRVKKLNRNPIKRHSMNKKAKKHVGKAVESAEYQWNKYDSLGEKAKDIHDKAKQASANLSKIKKDNKVSEKLDSLAISSKKLSNEYYAKSKKFIDDAVQSGMVLNALNDGRLEAGKNFILTNDYGKYTSKSGSSRYGKHKDIIFF